MAKWKRQQWKVRSQSSEIFLDKKKTSRNNDRVTFNIIKTSGTF